MRIAAITFGTEGDSRPLVALCRGLRDAGHDVELLAERSAAGLASQLGVPFEALAGDIGEEMNAQSADVLHRGHDAGVLAAVFARFARRNTADWMRALLHRAAGADAVICAGLAVYVGLSCAEKLQIAAIGAGLQPVMPTADFISPFLPPRRMPGWINRLSHRFVLALMWRAFRDAVNAARRDVAGQSPRRTQWRGYPIVFGFSPTLVPQPSDWGDDRRVVGAWYTPPDSAWQPSPPLRAFLAAGDAPIYVGFGSMTVFDRDAVRDVILAATTQRRVLLSSGWSGLAQGPLPPNVLAIDFVPHEWLFPQVSLVVHHGGAGTTHAAVKSGAPSVVVPLAGDQYFWAWRLHALGAAPAALPLSRLTAADLRQRLASASESEVRSRTTSLRQSMQGEDGIGCAVSQIEAWMMQPARHVPM